MSSSRDPERTGSPNSFYALSDDEEGEYNTVAHTTTTKGVKLLFCKSKVYIHPTPSAKDNRPGYIALLRQKTTPSSDRPSTSASTKSAETLRREREAEGLLMAWIPEHGLGEARDIYAKVDMADGEARDLVQMPSIYGSGHGLSGGWSAFAVPLASVYSLEVRPPNLGWWSGSIIIHSRAGENFPALFFHDSECQSTILQKKRRLRESFDPFGEGGAAFWGGDEVLRWLKRYVTVERSGAELNIYLVNPSEEDKMAFGDKPVTSAIVSSSRGAQIGGAAGAGGVDPVSKFIKETGWNIMEKLSKVTTFTRRTAESVAENQRVPPQVRRLLKNPEVQTLQDEFDSARIYLARWAMGIAEQSERDRNQRIWTASDVLEMEETDVGEFELLDAEMGSLSMKEQRKTVTLKEWNSFFDKRTGRLQVTVDEVKERIFHGGLDPDDGVRKEAWLFLLGVYEWDSSGDERKGEMASLRDEYVKLKGAWWDRLVDFGGEGPEGEWWREQKGRIEKDVHRTDRNVPIFAGEDTPHPDPNSPFAEAGTNVHLEQMKDMLLTYNEYNRDLGYVQGMSDLLAPIYAVMQDDAVAFWGFQHFMERMERNFLRDQSGMRKQLMTLDHLVQLMDPKLYIHLQSADSTNFFFFFRMLLVWFKREFQWLDVLHLWEVLWTDLFSSNFHIFVALAILEKHRDVIMNHLKHFDEVLKYINELSNTIDLESTLVRAEALFRRFQRTVEAIDKKGSFPAPKLRKRLPHRPTSSDDVNSAPTTPVEEPLTPPPSAYFQSARPSSSGAQAQASTSGADVDATSNRPATGRRASSGEAVKGKGKGKAGNEGKRKSTGSAVSVGEEMKDERPKTISLELRELLSRKVEILERKVVRREGEGVASIRK